jgi:hypothetical protein
MFSCLLKRVLPFTLTFVIGATLGWLFTFHGTGGRLVGMTARLERREAPFGYGYGHSCRMYRRDLVAETKPLVILFKPDARWPRWVDALGDEGFGPVTVRVTFGADGKVQQVEPVKNWVTIASSSPEGSAVWNRVERAARQIQFTPETINSVPVSVTKDVEIHFMAD